MVGPTLLGITNLIFLLCEPTDLWHCFIHLPQHRSTPCFFCIHHEGRNTSQGVVFITMCCKVVEQIRLGCFQYGRFIATRGISQHSELHENRFEDDLRTLSKMIWHFRRHISLPKKERCGKSCCIWMDPHLLFCADSAGPILKTPKFVIGNKRGKKVMRRE